MRLGGHRCQRIRSLPRGSAVLPTTTPNDWFTCHGHGRMLPKAVRLPV